MTKASIIIPTHNRPDYLQQLLDYYYKYGRDFDIIVADSSSEENKKLNKKIILSFPDLNMQYIDNYPEGLAPYYKFADIINYAKEKYCVFCGDDDFVVPNGIIRSIDFLEKNPDFTVAHGYYMAFWLKGKKGREKQFCWETRYPKESITFPESKDRLFRHLSEYRIPTFYGVHQTIFSKMIYKELLSSGVDIALFGELLLSMLTLIYGKEKCLDVFYMARRMSPSSDYRPTLIDFMNQGRYDEEYAKFRQCLAVHLSKNSQLNIEESKNLIDGAMSRYSKKYFSPGFKRTLRDKADCNQTLDKLYKCARFIYRLVTGGNLNSKYNFLAEYGDDFKKIKNQVIKLI